MNCDKCRHEGICKFEDDARKYEMDLHKWTDEHNEGPFKRPDCVDIIVKCEKFALKYIQGVHAK